MSMVPENPDHEPSNLVYIFLALTSGLNDIADRLSQLDLSIVQDKPLETASQPPERTRVNSLWFNKNKGSKRPHSVHGVSTLSPLIYIPLTIFVNIHPGLYACPRTTRRDGNVTLYRYPWHRFNV